MWADFRKDWRIATREELVKFWKVRVRLRGLGLGFGFLKSAAARLLLAGNT